MDAVSDVDLLPYVKFAVLAKGKLNTYIMLFQAFQWMDEHDEIHVLDGFACPYQMLDHQLPAIAKVPVCHKNGFLKVGYVKDSIFSSACNSIH